MTIISLGHQAGLEYNWNGSVWLDEAPSSGSKDTFNMVFESENDSILELFESLKKRRAVRYFSRQPIEEEVLRKLAYAAHRAPTGGNTPYRRVMVVNDEKTLRVLKQVCPGILGEPTAVLLIYTDLSIANAQRSTQYSSLVDAGAAAENVTLAATALGLGSCFTMSYSEAAVKELLGIPEGFRTGVMLQLGYPSENQPPAIRQKPEGRITELNRFGKRWK